MYNLFTKGYGIICSEVMFDYKISYKAKSLYSYFCSYSNYLYYCYPSIEKICDDLKIKDASSYRKYLKELVDNGYVVVKKRKNKGKYLNNEYHLLKLKEMKKNGYGMIPKNVMIDKRIDLGSKSIYSYLCCYSGCNNFCFPSLKKISFDLGIKSIKTLKKYMNQLIKNGYVKIEKYKNEFGKFVNNLYSLIGYKNSDKIDEYVKDKKLKNREKIKMAKNQDGKKSTTKNNMYSKINNNNKINHDKNKIDLTDSEKEFIKNKLKELDITNYSKEIQELINDSLIHIVGSDKVIQGDSKEVRKEKVNNISVVHIEQAINKYNEYKSNVKYKVNYLGSCIYSLIKTVKESFVNGVKNVFNDNSFNDIVVGGKVVQGEDLNDMFRKMQLKRMGVI